MGRLSKKGRQAGILRTLAVHELLEDRTLLNGTAGLDAPLYLPPQHNLFNYGGYLSGPSTSAPIAIAENYLRTHTADLGILPADINNYIVTTNYVTTTTGATTLTFQQTFAGLPVQNANYNITVTADGRVLTAAGGFVPGLSQKAPQPAAANAGSKQSITSAAGALQLNLAAPPALLRSVSGTSDAYSAPSISLDEIVTNLYYVAIPGNDVALAWNLTVRIPNSVHWYNVSVDAGTGALLAATDYAHNATYEVVAIPFESPTDAPRTIVVDPDIFLPTPSSVPSLFGWHDTDGVAGAEFTDTNGNNVSAGTDRNEDLAFDDGSQPDGLAGLNFIGSLVPFDPTMQPDTYAAASVVNLFYLNNIAHDVHYLYGFDEAARNFQVNTYGRGGLGNDPVNAFAHFGADTPQLNNAFFATPPDGQSPVMGMFQYNFTTPLRDSAFDAGIVLHEYGHGVSNRLTGNGQGLTALQSGGMGEGWGDWWGIMFTQRSAGETTTGRGHGWYTRGQTRTDKGSRDFAYDFDITDQQQQTFLAYGTGTNQDTEVHFAGSRWAAVLWDINHLLIQRYGFNPNIYDSTSGAGNIRALHLVMNALKIQPLNPSFLDGRDAILMADQLLYGGANQLEIWTAFARRGLGVGASTPGSNDQSLVTSFQIPDDVRVGFSISPDVARAEGDAGTTNFVFFIIPNRPVFTPANVSVATFDGTALAGVDYVSTTGSVGFVFNETAPKPFTVAVLGDIFAEFDETFVVRITGVTGGLGVGNEAVGTIVNDDVDLSIGDTTVVEGNAGTRNAVFTVSAFGVLNRTITFEYTTIGITAVAASDFLPRSGTGTIPSGSGAAAITVPIVGDTSNEDTETFAVLLTSVKGARLDKSLGIGTILDDDRLPALYVNDVQLTTISGGLMSAEFTVALDTASGRDVSVGYFTADGGATDGVDYLGRAGALTFTPGITTRQVSIPVMTSGQYAPNKKFYLNLSNPQSASLADPQGAATIVHADGPPSELIMDDGDLGFTQSGGGWTNVTNTLAHQLDYDHHAGGAGGAASTWTFADIANGTYQVMARWTAFGNHATNAPYTVLDGATPLSTVLVNQQVAPLGDQSNGAIWQSLGTFQIGSRTLAVRLANNANGIVVADAIRILVDGINAQRPEMDVAYLDRSIGTPDDSPAVEDGTDFGTVKATSGSVIRTFVITNNGNADLHLGGSPRVEVSGAHAADFTVLSQPAAVVGPGKQTTFQVKFDPSAEGLRTAILSIASDDEGENPYAFHVQGTGGPPAPGLFVLDDSMVGFSQVGDWTTTSDGSAYQGQMRTIGAGAGNDKAVWAFTGLAPGSYDVYATWVAAAENATNAPFVVSNLADNSYTIFVNQQKAPAIPLNAGHWGGLGLIDVTLGALEVSLSNNANAVVVADAVMLLRHGFVPPAAPPAPIAHNDALPQDVNGDSRVSLRDALILINNLASQSAVPSVVPSAAPLAATAAASGASAYYLDVNADGRVSLHDALLVINYLLTPPAAAPAAAPQASTSAEVPPVLAAAAVDRALAGNDDSSPYDAWPSAVVPRSDAPGSVKSGGPAPIMLTEQTVWASFASDDEASDDMLATDAEWELVLLEPVD